MAKQLLIFTIFSFIFALPSFGRGSAPGALAIIPWLQIPNKDYSVGPRLSLGWGRHRRVHGLDFGVIGNITQERIYATQISGIFNLNERTYVIGLQATSIVNYNSRSTFVYGIQAAGIFNINKGNDSGKARIHGAQTAIGINYNREGYLVGVQAALLGNLGRMMNIYGVQFSAANMSQIVGGIQAGGYNSAQTVAGIQFGLYNKAEDIYGFQIGLVNITQNLTGLQIGLVNINKSGFFKFFPLINFGF